MTGRGGVELEASIFVRILSLCTSVWVPLTDILDSSPRVSIRALALGWTLFFCGGVSVGARERPRGGSPRTHGGIFDSFEGYTAQSAEALSMSILEGELKALTGLFHTGVTTYSRWSERHLPEIEFLAGNPSENPCPVR